MERGYGHGYDDERRDMPMCFALWVEFRDKISEATKKGMARPEVKIKIAGQRNSPATEFKKGHIPWSKGKGKPKLKVQGRSIAEDIIYNRLLKYFNSPDIIRNTRKVVRNSLTGCCLDLK